MASHSSIEPDATRNITPTYELEEEIRNDVLNILNEVKEEIKQDRKIPFVEREYFHLDDFEYRRDGTDPGKIVIFNNECFDDKTRWPKRQGSRRDVNEIITCFQRLGFNIDEKDIHTDLKATEIFEQLDALLTDQETLRNTNSLIVFVLSHGEKNEEIAARDKSYKCSEIWTRFNRCKELKGKPKMFVLQACKGTFYTTVDGNDSAFNPTTDPSKLLNLETFTVNKLDTDMLLLYSTLEGNISFRDIHTGTWFIQELCKNFSAYGRRDDVVSMITRVLKCVCNCYYLDDVENEKQMPIFVSTLSRKFYLNRNKDRHLLLEINKKQDEIYAMLMQILES